MCAAEVDVAIAEGSDAGRGVAISADDSAVVVGTFLGLGDADTMRVFKYLPDGTEPWARNVGGSTKGEAEAHGVDGVEYGYPYEDGFVEVDPEQAAASTITVTYLPEDPTSASMAHSRPIRRSGRQHPRPKALRRRL